MNALLSPSRRKNRWDVPKPIDWELLRRRLKAAQLSTEGGVTMSKERRDFILAQRARRAAVPLMLPVSRGNRGALVVFELSGQRYGLESQFVREVISGAVRAPLPGAPAFVDGLVPLRGEIIVVVDLRRVFDLPVTLNAPSVVVILRQGAVQFGILADALAGMDSFSEDRLRLPLQGAPAVQRELIRGVLPGPVTVLNGRQLLAGAWASFFEQDI